ncbi:hypothetical protein SNB42_00025, partial [Escherichia coli]|nr:hypothetical protein [Escherichia coli]
QNKPGKHQTLLSATGDKKIPGKKQQHDTRNTITGRGKWQPDSQKKQGQKKKRSVTETLR